MIIFTGDGGMISAVRRALDYNWNVEVWAYRNSLAKANLEKDKLKVKYLDDYFDDVVFHTLEWRLQIPKERSFIFTLEKVHEEEKNEILEWFVKAVTGLTRMPMAGKWIRDKQGDRSPSSHLVIVCSVGKLTLKEDSRTDFVKNETCRDHNPHLKRNTFHFSRDQWNKLPNILFVEKERLYPQVRVELESFIEEAINLNANVLDNPKYDFNTDVYQKVEENLLRFGRNGTTCLPEAEVEIITFAELIFRYKPLLRSVPQFLQDMRLDDLPYEYAHKSTSAVEDDGEGGFTVESGRKIKKKFQKYSKECKYSFRCVKGFRCIYNHSDKEKEFFKVQKEPLLRKTYKFKDCDLYRNQSCKFKMNFSYMCPFAHGSYCTFCKCDTDGGHDLNQCPAPHQLENMQFFTHS